MTALISLFIAIILSALVTRIATVALGLTGLSHEVARFQSLSAFSGVGFTTSESEHIVNHPARRRILILVIRLGNIGVVTVISSLVLTFVNASSATQTIRLILLITGLVILFLLARSDWLDTHLSNLIQTILRRYTDLEVRDYASLLGIQDGYRLAEIDVQADSWLDDKTLAEANVMAEGIMVVGIYRPNGNYVGVPQGETRIHAKDRLVVYGHEEALSQISHRLRGHEGDEAHREAKSKQDSVLRRQRAKDSLYSDGASNGDQEQE